MYSVYPGLQYFSLIALSHPEFSLPHATLSVREKYSRFAGRVTFVVGLSLIIEFILNYDAELGSCCF